MRIRPEEIHTTGFPQASARSRIVRATIGEAVLKSAQLREFHRLAPAHLSEEHRYSTNLFTEIMSACSQA